MIGPWRVSESKIFESTVLCCRQRSCLPNSTRPLPHTLLLSSYIQFENTADICQPLFISVSTSPRIACTSDALQLSAYTTLGLVLATHTRFTGRTGGIWLFWQSTRACAARAPRPVPSPVLLPTLILTQTVVSGSILYSVGFQGAPRASFICS